MLAIGSTIDGPFRLSECDYDDHPAETSLQASQLLVAAALAEDLFLLNDR